MTTLNYQPRAADTFVGIVVEESTAAVLVEVGEERNQGPSRERG